jgi:hypothetical protein
VAAPADPDEKQKPARSRPTPEAAKASERSLPRAGPRRADPRSEEARTIVALAGAADAARRRRGETADRGGEKIRVLIAGNVAAHERGTRADTPPGLTDCDYELGNVRGSPKRASKPLSPNLVSAEIPSLDRFSTKIPLARCTPALGSGR